MAEFLDVTISIKRLNKRQQNRANPSKNDKELEPEAYLVFSNNYMHSIHRCLHTAIGRQVFRT